MADQTEPYAEHAGADQTEPYAEHAGADNKALNMELVSTALEEMQLADGAADGSLANVTQSMLSFALAHLPEDWQPVPAYKKPYLLFRLSDDDDEYQSVALMFYGTRVVEILRVQNPLQYGQYFLRREMIKSTYLGIVFHEVHKDDLEVALKFNCDYRRYQKKIYSAYDGNFQNPMFHNSLSDLLRKTIHPITDIYVLVLQILTKEPQRQCDYFVQYVVKFTL